MMKKRVISWMMAAAVAFTFLTGCQSQGKGTGDVSAGKEASESAEVLDEKAEAKEESASQKSDAAEDKGTISVTYVKSPLNVPSIVEKDQEIFAEKFGELGYNVSYSDLTTGPEQTQALASGDIQFLYAVGATSVILAASNEADIKIISSYSRSPKAFKLFGKDDSIQSPEDLRGKKVAGPKGTILHELLVAYLAGGGMTEEDIEFVSMGIPDAQAALAGGSVDAALLAGPTDRKSVV